LFLLPTDSKDGKDNLISEPDTTESTTSTSNDTITMEKIRQFFADKLKFGSVDSDDSKSSNKQVLETATTEGLIKHWKKGGFKKIVTMVGAGISTSAGIPDFRSPSTGLYHNLMKYDLPYPEAIFDLDYFRKDPKPFFKLAKELYPGTFKPTPSHYFVKMLDQKGLLVRHYTQNIDTLDRIAGIDAEKIVEAHGTFYTGHCMDCREAHTMEWMRGKLTGSCTKMNLKNPYLLQTKFSKIRFLNARPAKWA
jgi:NAD+-dependent protein deacetylase sirtuin 2